MLWVPIALRTRDSILLYLGSKALIIIIIIIIIIGCRKKESKCILHHTIIIFITVHELTWMSLLIVKWTLSYQSFYPIHDSCLQCHHHNNNTIIVNMKLGRFIFCYQSQISGATIPLPAQTNHISANGRAAGTCKSSVSSLENYRGSRFKSSFVLWVLNLPIPI